MRVHKTGHQIADTVSDLIGDLPDDDYKIAYGILRHNEFKGNWFEIDKGLWGANHFDGTYRISFKNTQPIYHEGLSEPHDLDLEPWKKQEGYNLICPPTIHVCQFFKVDYSAWLMNAIRQGPYKIRHKSVDEPIRWNEVGKVITYNSSVGIEALRRGIPVISDPVNSSIGSYTNFIQAIDGYDRDQLLSFISSHQFKLGDKGKIWGLIQHYMSS